MSSSYERGKKAEERAKKWLQENFSAQFSRKGLQVGTKTNGKPAMHNFDLVSEDGQIVAEVKSHQLTKSGSVPSGKISDAYKACLMLEKISAQKRFLILTDSKFYELFKRCSNGKISKQIEIVLLADETIDREIPNMKPTQTISREKSKVSFDVFWSELTSRLSTRQHITNWTVFNGRIGEDFDAIYTGGNYIFAYPKSAGVQKIPKNDFETIYESWSKYLARLILRKQLVAMSRFTKYIISIIHQYLKP